MEFEQKWDEHYSLAPNGIDKVAKMQHNHFHDSDVLEAFGVKISDPDDQPDASWDAMVTFLRFAYQCYWLKS